MGVKIFDLAERRSISLEFLANKRIAIDAYNWMYQFLSIIRQYDGTPLMTSRGEVTSHLSGLFYRTTKLMQAGIKPIYVFDGKPPAFKYVLQGRAERKQEARVQWREALDKKDFASARSAAQRTSRITKEMKEQAKELLSLLGVPVIQAPSEGEAQCAHLCKQGKVFATASQDADAMMFGSTRLVRNLSITGKRKVPRKNVYMDIKPELILLKDVLESTGLTREKLIILGMLVGTDFNPGIKGIGPKKALKLVKEGGGLKTIIKKVDWEGPDPEKVFNFFMKPPVENVDIKFGSLQKEKIMKMLVDKFEFSSDRIEKSLDNLEKKQKSSLGRWLK